MFTQVRALLWPCSVRQGLERFERDWRGLNPLQVKIPLKPPPPPSILVLRRLTEHGLMHLDQDFTQCEQKSSTNAENHTLALLLWPARANRTMTGAPTS